MFAPIRPRPTIPIRIPASVAVTVVHSCYVLEDLLSPTLVFVLFYAGLMLIGVELLSPGVSVPGVAGVIALVGAFIGFGTLPVRLAGVIFLLVSVGFFLFEAKYPGISFGAVGAVACLVLGGFLLVDPSVEDAEAVSPWAIVPIAIAAVGFFTFMIPAALRAQREPSKLAADNLLGSEGVAETRIDPTGIANVRSETWSVETTGDAVRKGQRVRVVAVEGVRLKVEPVADNQTMEHQGG